MNRLFTHQEIEIALAASRALAAAGLEKSPEFMAEYLKNINLKEEMEKTINLLENVEYWMGKAKVNALNGVSNEGV